MWLYRIFIFLILCIHGSGAPLHKGILWNRIPKNRTKERIYEFIMDRQLDDCFEFYENSSLLRLKCWVRNHLEDVTITIDTKKQSVYI